MPHTYARCKANHITLFLLTRPRRIPGASSIWRRRARAMERNNQPREGVRMSYGEGRFGFDLNGTAVSRLGRGALLACLGVVAALAAPDVQASPVFQGAQQLGGYLNSAGSS